MKTSSFFTFAGPGRVSIARSAPRSALAGFVTYAALAPGPWFQIKDRGEYEHRYAQQLAKLDAQTVWDQLHMKTGGHEPTLLCWEHPADIAAGKTFCHRHQVARWLEQHLGHRVDELTA